MWIPKRNIKLKIVSIDTKNERRRYDLLI